MKKKRNSIFLIIIIIISIFLVVQYSYSFKNTNNTLNSVSLSGLKVSFIDVGQADSILIQDEVGNVLIDAGNTEDGPLLTKYLQEQNISEFNYVIGTHAHEDHIGGMADIINNFKVDNFYMPDVMTTTKTFEDLLDTLNNKNVQFQTPNIDDKFNVGDANFIVCFVGTDNSNLNNSSIVLKLIYGNISVMLMGDATNSVEKEIISKDIKADVLKVGHHGSATSTSNAFLKKVNPSYAIISVGKDNTYNLPSSKTIDKLNNLGIKIYRTDENGSIILTSDGSNIEISSIKTNTNGGE